MHDSIAHSFEEALENPSKISSISIENKGIETIPTAINDRFTNPLSSLNNFCCALLNNSRCSVLENTFSDTNLKKSLLKLIMAFELL